MISCIAAIEGIIEGVSGKLKFFHLGVKLGKILVLLRLKWTRNTNLVKKLVKIQDKGFESWRVQKEADGAFDQS